MVKKKILGLLLAGVIIAGGAVPAFTSFAATETPSTTVSEKRHGDKNLPLEERAKKLGVDITGLSEEEAIKKVEEAKVAKLAEVAKRHGIDTTNLSKEEIKAKIKEAKEAKKAAGTKEKKEIKESKKTS